MTVYLVILATAVLTVYSHTPEADPSAPQDPCYQTHLNKGRIKCTELAGEFIFGNGTTCDRRLYRDVMILRGRIAFMDAIDDDPMGCFPNLTTIISPPKPEFAEHPVIYIADSVKLMNKFTVNKHLVLYGLNPIWIRVMARNFRMSRNDYLHLAGRFGAKRLDIPYREEEGECNYEKNTRVVFMKQLESCKFLHGTLTVTAPKSITHSIRDLRKIDGCIDISKTHMELEHIYFLRNVKEIGCLTPMAPFVNNSKLCIPETFVTMLVSKYKDMKESDRTILQKNFLSELNNVNIPGCDKTCTAYEMEKREFDNKCYTIYGDIRLRKSIAPKLKHLSTLRGRLLIEGFDMADPWSALPNLTLIKTMTKEPVVRIQYNHFIEKLSIPKNLKIESPAKTLLYVKHNYAFKLKKEQFKELEEQFGKDRVAADVLKNKECFFPKPIKDLSELDNCIGIHGDLILSGNVTGHTTTKLKRVTGCIRVNGTELETLHFLEMIDKRSGTYCTGGHIVTFNKKLCPRFIYERLKIAGPREHRHMHIVHGNKKNCYNLCTREQLFTTTKCNSIVEGVRMSEHVREQLLTSLAGTDEVHGPIRVLKTNAPRIDEFVSLKKIAVDDEGPAIDIRENDDLEFIDLSRLQKIDSPVNSSKLVVIRKNGDYRMPFSQYKKLVDLVGEERLDIDHHPNTSWYYGLVTGCCIALVVCCIAGTIAFTVVLKKRRDQNAKDEANKKLLQDPKLTGIYGDNQQSNMMTPMEPESMDNNETPDEIPMTARTAMIGAAPNAKYGAAPAGAEYVCMTKTAATARIGKDQYFGQLRDNASKMEDVPDPKTAATAYIGKGEFYGQLRNNASKMEGTQGPKTAVTGYDGNRNPLRTNASVGPKGPVTAKTVMLGKDNYYGQLRDNASKLEEAHDPKTAATAYIGKGQYFGQLRKNASKTEDGHGPKTAATAYLGKEQYFGQLRKNASKAEDGHGPKTAATGYDGNKNPLRTNASVGPKGPVTAKTGMIGNEKYHGLLRTNASRGNETHGPRTANTAMLAGKEYHGDLRNNQPAEPKEPKGPVTAVKAVIGSKEYDGNEKKNAFVATKAPTAGPEKSTPSAEKDPVTAMTAKNNGKAFSKDEREVPSKEAKSDDRRSK